MLTCLSYLILAQHERLLTASYARPPQFFRSLDFQLPTFHPDGEYIWLAECHCAVVLQIIVLLEVSIRRLAKASSFPTIAFWEAYRFLDFLVELHRDLPIVLVPEREYLFPGYVLQFATAFSEGMFTPLKRTGHFLQGAQAGCLCVAVKRNAVVHVRQTFRTYHYSLFKIDEYFCLKSSF